MSVKSGSLLVFVYSWDCENCLLYRVMRCPLFRGCFSIEANGRTVETSFQELSDVSWVSAVEGSGFHSMTKFIGYAHFTI